MVQFQVRLKFTQYNSLNAKWTFKDQKYFETGPFRRSALTGIITLLNVIYQYIFFYVPHLD